MVDDNIFWSEDSKNNITIGHSMLLKNLEEYGFANLRMPNGGKTQLVRIEQNILEPVDDAEINRFLFNQLKNKGLNKVVEKLTRGISSYTSPKKLDLLRVVPSFKKSDDKETIWFYFSNTAVKVRKSNVELVRYNQLPHQVWRDRIIPRKFTKPQAVSTDFKQFCLNISGKDNKRYTAIMTNIGYLLSTYKDPGNPKAVIFIDEKVDNGGKANGGTGKSLIAKAIGHMRNMVTVDGKNYNPTYPFSNQRVEMSTDLICFDDMGKNFNLENIFSMTTSGITVNQKYKPAYYVEAAESPKILINSNYVVKGPGGNADVRRRSEFEVAAHYSLSYQPVDEFGDLFFEGWDDVEWERFDSFMIECAQEYLKRGLIIATPINLVKNRLMDKTSPEFVEYMYAHLVKNAKVDKRLFLQKFNYEYGKTETSHMFTKMLKVYAEEMSLIYGDTSSGGEYYFWLNDNNPKGEVNQGEKKGSNLQSSK